MNNKYISLLSSNIREKKLTYYSCLLSLIILPVHVAFIPPMMIIWTIAWTFENRGHFKEIFDFSLPGFRLFVGFALFFAWYLSGILYSEDKYNGMLLIFRRLSFIFFPFLLISPGEYIRTRIKFLIRAFSLSTLFYIIISFVFATYRSLHFEAGSLIFNVHPVERDFDNYFFGTDFSFSQHPTYLAMYVVLSTIIALDSFFDATLKRLQRYLWLIGAITLAGSLYFISSRTGILAALLLFPICLIVEFKKIRNSWISVLISLLVIVALVLSLLANHRISYYVSGKSDKSIVDKFMVDNRVPIWKSSLHVIKQHPVSGVGVGDASMEISNTYLEAGYTEAYYDNMNAHNQFLEILVANGIIGFVIFMTMTGYMIIRAVTQRSLIYILFILIFLMFFMFESILNRIAGVTFFSLFSFLLLSLNNGINQNPASQQINHQQP